jgi:hypothetical protein
MPFRFRRTFKILPGVKINVSKSGMSVTVGPKGYHLTFGKQGIRQTIDFPGEGLSHTKILFKDDDDKRKGNNQSEKRDDDDDGVGCFPWGCLAFVLILAVVGYFVADAFHLVPPNTLSHLFEQMTQWVKSAGL